MNLKPISLYANFSARTYDYLPNSRYEPIDLEDIVHLVPSHFTAAGGSVWLLGVSADAEMQKRFTGRLVSIGVGIIVDSWFAVDQLVSCAGSDDICTIVDIGYLAYLFDPRPYLTALKKLMLSRPVNCLFVSRGASKTGSRHWTAADFEVFLRSSGIEILEKGRGEGATFYFEARLSRHEYARYLQTHCGRACDLDADFLVLTTEHASVRPTGGIGTYVANLGKLDPACVVLFASPETIQSNAPRTIFTSDLIGETSLEQLFDGDGLLEGVRILLYTLPGLRTCEFQDWQSIGFRIVQARKTGGLPASLALRVFLHGNLDFTKHGSGSDDDAVYDLDEIKSVAKDRFIFAEVDSVVSPSRFLLNILTGEFGYDLEKAHVRRLPFDLQLIDEAPATITFSTPDMLVYMGKFSALKGWPDFIEAVERLGARGRLAGIERIVALAPGRVPRADAARLQRHARLQHMHLPHEEMLAFLKSHRDRALFVIPSGGENYPYAVLELLLSACRFTAYRSGGALEVLDDDAFAEALFARPNAAHLADKLFEIINSDPQASGQRVLDKAHAIRARQRATNQGYASTDLARPDAPIRAFDPRVLEEVSVITPFFNTPIAYMEDLARSLRTSLLEYAEWIIIDDGSTEESSRQLLQFCLRQPDLRVRLVRQDNRGLAGARNRGLAEVKTRFAFFVDSDDVILPHTLGHTVLAMAIQKRPALAVSGFPCTFEQIDKLPADTTPFRNGLVWKPLGISGARVLGLLRNEFIGASCMVDVEVARRLGGWDASDRTTWEDWAFYLRAAWAGEEILLLPWVSFLYRDTPGSMSKTYSRYRGFRRLVRNVGVLDRFEANALMSLVRGGGARRDRSFADIATTRPEAKPLPLASLDRPSSVLASIRAIAYFLFPLGKRRRAKRRVMLAALRSRVHHDLL